MSICSANIFLAITRHQFNHFAAFLENRKGPETAGTHQKGTSQKKQILDEARRKEKDSTVPSVLLGAMNMRHFNRREIALHIKLSKHQRLKFPKKMSCLSFKRK